MLKRDVIDAMEQGTILFTTVSAKRIAVRVIRQTERAAFGTRSGSNRVMVKFECKRIDNGKVLPKHRSAQSLHCTDGRRGEWGGMTERQDRPAFLAADVASMAADILAGTPPDADTRIAATMVVGPRGEWPMLPGGVTPAARREQLRQRAERMAAAFDRQRARADRVASGRGASVCGSWVDGVWIDGDRRQS